MILVDGSNLYFALKAHDLENIHMDRLARWLDPNARGKRFYTAPFKGHSGFVEALKHMGWEVRFSRLKVDREKGVDVSLAVDMVLLAGRGEPRITLVSGDTDLVPAVEAARSLGTRVVVAQFQDALGMDLVRAADDVVLLDGAPWDKLRWHKAAGSTLPAAM